MATASIGTVLVVVAAIVVPVVATSGKGAHRAQPFGPSPSQPTHSSQAYPTTDPLDLVGSWHVQAAGEAASTSLILGGSDVDLGLFRPCGLMDGEWNADAHGQFIGVVEGGDSSCFEHHPHADHIPWLAAAVGYRKDGADRVLLNVAGEVVARLSPGAHPTTGPNDAPDLASPPAISPELRMRFREPAPLPESVTAATVDDVLGHWKPIGEFNPKASLTFHPDGSWSATDGCNGTGGRFAIGPDGQLLTTTGPTTQVECGRPVQVGARAAMDRGQLVMYAKDGHALGRYQRS